MLSFLLLATSQTNVPSQTSAVTISHTADTVLLSVVGLVIILLAAIVALVKPKDSKSAQDARAAFFHSATWRFLQTAVFGLLVLAAIWHSLWSPSGPDTTTVTFLVLIIIIAIVPVVEKVVFPGHGELDLISSQVKDEAIDLTQSAKVVQIAFATAAQVIADAQTNLAVQLREMDVSARKNFIERTLNDATSTIAALLLPAGLDTSAEPQKAPLATRRTDSASTPTQSRDDPSKSDAARETGGEPLRVTAWVKTRNSKALSYVAGWPAALGANLINTIVEIGSDPASAVYLTGQYRNYTNLPADLRPPAPNNKIKFAGILIVPMHVGGSIIGVLQVERYNAERFEPAQTALTRALASLYGLALS